MKEQLEIIGQRLLKNLDRVSIVVFLLLALVAGYFYFAEQNFVPDTVETPASVAWVEQFPNDEYRKIQEQVTNAPDDIRDNPESSILLAVRMFDRTSVEAEQETARAVEADYERAQQAFTSGNLSRAEELVESILRRNPNHQNALELKTLIEETRNPPAEEGAEAESSEVAPGG